MQEALPLLSKSIFKFNKGNRALSFALHLSEIRQVFEAQKRLFTALGFAKGI